MRHSKVYLLVLSGLFTLLGVGLLWASHAGALPSTSSAGPPPYQYVPAATLTLPDGIGDDPRVLAANPNTGLLYLANYGSADISVVSGTQFVTTLPGPSRPWDIAANPTTGYIYVLDEWSDNAHILHGTEHVGVVPLHSRPSHLAVDSQRGYIYASHLFSDVVTILSATEVITTMHLRETISGARRPIAVNPTTGLAYLFSPDDMITTSTAFILSGTQVLGTQSLAGLPDQVEVDPVRGYVYASALGEGLVHVLSGTEVLGSIPVPGNPWQIAVDPSSGFAYVQCDGPSAIVVLSGTVVVGSVNVEPYHVQSLVVEPLSGYLYAVLHDFSDESFHLLLLQGTSEVARVPLPPSMYLGVDGCGHTYVTHWGGYLSVFQGETRVGRIPARSFPTAFLSVPETGYTYIANGPGSDTISVVSGTQVVATVTVGYSPVLLARLPGQGLVYVGSRDDPSISVIRGTELLTTTYFMTEPCRFAAEPSRGWMYVNFRDSSEIAVFSGTEHITSFDLGGVPTGMTVDPVQGHLYVAWHQHHTHYTVSQISGTGILTETTLPGILNLGDLDFAPQTGYLYVTSHNSTEVLLLHDMHLTGTIPLTAMLMSQVLNPVNNDLYVHEWGMGPEWLAVIHGREVVTETSLPLHADHLYSDMTSERVYALMSGGDRDLFYVWQGPDLVGQGITSSASWRIGASPGGHYVYTISGGAGAPSNQIWVYREYYLPYRDYLPLVVKGL